MLVVLHLDRSTDDVGMDRKLPTASIDQYRERDVRRAAEVRQFIERRTNGAAGVEHIVHYHHALAGYVAGQVCSAEYGPRPDSLEVVAIERDVERTAWHLDVLVLVDQPHDSRGERDTAPLHAHEHKVIRAIRELDDLI